MKNFKVIVSAVLFLIGIVLFCFGHWFWGAVCVGFGIAIWLPKGDGNNNRSQSSPGEFTRRYYKAN